MSTIKATTLSTQGGSTVPMDTVVSGSAKAWVNFNGTGTVAIRAAFNVSSITDNGTGDYTANFTTALSDANYSVVVSGDGYQVISAPAFNVGTVGRGMTTTSVRMNSVNLSGTNTDIPAYSVAIFR